MESEPPLEERFKDLLRNLDEETKTKEEYHPVTVKEDNELPLVDLNLLNLSDSDHEKCKRMITDASSKWGFFQVVNHGVPHEILERMHCQRVKLFMQPFQKKVNENNHRWGTFSAKSSKQLSWSESFHIPLNNVLASDDCEFSETIEDYAMLLFDLAVRISKILEECMGCKSSFISETCVPSSCFIRMNRYPPCPVPFQVFGLVPHTDSDFLTVLHQSHVGGLQLLKEGKWVSVRPNPNALVINIGDLFQAWSGGIYKSVEHRVVANKEVERFSTALFLCPSYETVIRSFSEPPVYKSFSFRDYRQQVREDVKTTGNKVGLQRFLL